VWPKWISAGEFNGPKDTTTKRTKLEEVQGGLDPNKISDLGADFGIIVL